MLSGNMWRFILLFPTGKLNLTKEAEEVKTPHAQAPFSRAALYILINPVIDQ